MQLMLPALPVNKQAEAQLSAHVLTAGLSSKPLLAMLPLPNFHG